MLARSAMLSSSVRLAGAAPEFLKRAAVTTRCRSCAASRPQENASLFISIAAPLRSIAFMIASSDNGIAPRWNAKPSMKELVAMLSPISAVASPVASRMSRSEALTASLSDSRIVPASKSISGSMTKPAVASRSASTIARVGSDAHMAHDRAVLLRHPGEVERRARLAVDMGGHAEQRADGDDAGTANAGDKDIVVTTERGHRRHRQIGEQGGWIGRGAVG